MNNEQYEKIRRKGLREQMVFLCPILSIIALESGMAILCNVCYLIM